MGNFLIIAPYIVLLFAVPAIGLFTFALSRSSVKEWKNWYHNFALLQFLGLILLMLGYVFMAIIQITHTQTEIIQAILVLGLILFVALGGFFIFRAYWLRTQKGNK